MVMVCAPRGSTSRSNAKNVMGVSLVHVVVARGGGARVVSNACRAPAVQPVAVHDAVLSVYVDQYALSVAGDVAVVGDLRVVPGAGDVDKDVVRGNPSHVVDVHSRRHLDP